MQLLLKSTVATNNKKRDDGDLFKNSATAAQVEKSQWWHDWVMSVMLQYLYSLEFAHISHHTRPSMAVAAKLLSAFN